MTMNAVVTGDATPDATLTTQGAQAPSEDLTPEHRRSRRPMTGVAAVRWSSRTSTPAATTTRTDRSLVVHLDPGDAGNRGRHQHRLVPHGGPADQGDWSVTAYAVDTSGQRDLNTTGTRRATRSTRVTSAPTLTEGLLAPTESASFTEGKIFVSGRAEDDQPPARPPRPARSRWRSSTAPASTSPPPAPSGRGELARGVPDQPGHARVELLLHDPGPAGGELHRQGARHRPARADHGRPVGAPRDRDDPAGQPEAGGGAAGAGVPENVCQFDGRSSTDENAADADLHLELRHRRGHRHRPEPQDATRSPGTYTVTLTAKDEWGACRTPVTQTFTSPSRPATRRRCRRSSCRRATD